VADPRGLKRSISRLTAFPCLVLLFPHYRAVRATLGARADHPSRSHYASRSPSENSVCRSETAVPPKCANETRALRSRQMSRKFVSARKLSLLDSRKVPGLTEEFAKQKGQKLEIRQIFNSWRRERDSNHESGSPYPFEKSGSFRVLGTREGSCR
jgi:hypothetical protein